MTLPVLNRCDKTLSTAAFCALIDVMHEAVLPRFGFGAGKAHLGTAFHALWIFVETLGLALWHSPPTTWLLTPGELRIILSERFGNQPKFEWTWLCTLCASPETPCEHLLRSCLPLRGYFPLYAASIHELPGTSYPELPAFTLASRGYEEGAVHEELLAFDAIGGQSGHQGRTWHSDDFAT